MAKYVCIKKCYFFGKRWKLGEILTPGKNDKVPKHFKPYAASDFKEVEEDKDPSTFSELEKRNVAETVAAEEKAKKRAETLANAKKVKEDIAAKQGDKAEDFLE